MTQSTGQNLRKQLRCSCMSSAMHGVPPLSRWTSMARLRVWKPVPHHSEH